MSSSISLQVFIYYIFLLLIFFNFIQEKKKKNTCYSFPVEAIKKITNYNIKFLH